MAGFAFQDQVCHELHLNGDDAGTFAFLTASSVGIERKMLRREIQLLGKWLFGKKLADGVVGFNVCGGIGTGALSYWILIDKLHMFHLLPVALETAVFARGIAHLIQMALQGGVEDAFHERRLAAAANSCNHIQHVERKLHVNTFQVVHSCTFDFNRHIPRATGCRSCNRVGVGEITHGV